MTLDDKTIISVAVIGGTGKEGSGLAMRWALNGYRVIIGSRDAERAASHAYALNRRLGADVITGMANPDAASQANMVVLSVPYSAHYDTLEAIREHLEGKLLVDITVPLLPPKVRTVYVPEGKSAALEAQMQIGDGVRIVSAFQNVSADKLQDPNSVIECDVLVTGDDEDAKAEVAQLVAAAGMRAVDAGPLVNSVAAEALTPVLLYINKKYGIKGAGIRITGM
jgi:8-hydroxy-5-deazaflavin:NADPH oxidoreductase